MINPEKRKVIFSLHEEGMGVREISNRLKISRNTVRTIIKQKGVVPETVRNDKIKIDTEILKRLYSECDGWVERIHEKLEEEGTHVGYSTLTRMIQELGLGQCQENRCDRVPDEPGIEMQQDISPYTIKIGDKQVRVVGSILYLRYSKIRYLKFYRTFDRFKMKCFFHEALIFFGYSARVCIIDNTNLARLRGTGKNALIVPEMEQFAKQFGFKFACHEVGHPNRKAGNERSFYTVETNFFPGRKFENLEDLNNQAFQWATVNLILKRGTDQYGYTAFDANYYWVPGTKREDITIIQYSQTLKIYCQRKLLVEYKFPADGVRNEIISPDGMPRPKHMPHDRKKPTQEEEQKLRKAGEEVEAYLNFAVKTEGTNKHRFIRELFNLYQKIALPLFITTIKRALKYRITDIATIERIAILQMTNGNYKIPIALIDDQFQNRESYMEGCESEKVDLSIYDKLCEEEEKNG
ncbi:helix-turn-helix domain-containing protein [Candidatus Desantisbacteria bacterium]|nr:helix-turn-helix domain-containing protein [Candidatus Desantisbacteria bacterium]